MGKGVLHATHRERADRFEQYASPRHVSPYLLAHLQAVPTMKVMAGPQYDASPQRLDEYVQVDEVDALLTDDGRYLAKDHKRTAHFLARVKTTLVAFRAQVQQLHRDVQSMQIRTTSVGAPTSLDPRSAAKFLPPEELAALADALIQQKFAALAAAEAEQRATRADLLRKLNSLKFAVTTITEDFTLPDEVRERVRAAFHAPLEADFPPAAPDAPAVPVARPADTGDAPDASLDDLFR